MVGPRELYDATGDSEASMRLMVSELNSNSSGNTEQSPQQEYNCLLLTALATTTSTTASGRSSGGSSSSGRRDTDKEGGRGSFKDDGGDAVVVSLLNESLEDARTIVTNSHSETTPSKRAIAEDWILAYNRGLVLLSRGDAEESIRLAWSYLRGVVVVEDSSPSSDQNIFIRVFQQSSPLLEMACRMGFLILEGMLTLYPTRIHGRTSDATTRTTTTTNNNNKDTTSSKNSEFEETESPSIDLRLLDTVLAWLTENVEHTKTQPTSAAATGPSESGQDGSAAAAATATNPVSSSTGPDPQLKFLLSLYESRVNFFERTTGDLSIRDKHMRSARKELKQAMEIFQHKLRPERADTASMTSMSSYSEEVANATGGGSNGNSNTDGKQQQQQQSPAPSRATSPSPPSAALSSSKSNSNLSRILQGQNQAALNLKANAEQLKGNVKKSLVLCSEAQSFNNNSNSNNNSVGISNGSIGNYYDAIHQNNLGIVYESSGKSHLALHAFSKAVRSAVDSSNNHGDTIGGHTGSNHHPGARFEPDGTARPDVTLHVLNNAGVCALKSRNYSAAYECYAIGLATSKSWRKRPRTWLRLSEACIGLNARAQKERASEGFTSKCSRVEVDGKAKGVLLKETGGSHSDDESTQRVLPSLASPEDLKSIRDNALMRARMAIKIALDLFGEYDESTNDTTSSSASSSDELALQNARLSFAYVCLEDKDFVTALKYARTVLHHGNTGTRETPKTTAGGNEHDPAESARQTMIKRQAATARMYASEACASLGAPMESLQILVGDGEDDAFDRLSSDLGGVTIGMASTNNKAKSRLAKAQTMVRCSASAASASLGNLTASKQLAMSAQAMENSYSPSREGTSQARKALIYCMLREGNHGAALTLLRSAR